MSKRSRTTALSPGADQYLMPAIEDEREAVEGHAPPTKFSQIDCDALAARPARVMQCNLVPHREILRFETQEQYEVHYTKEHANRCATCLRNFPSPRFLELHIEENHNALREALAARGEKTYGCFVEDCDRKCSTPQKRRLHLIDKHMFPKTYNFRIIDQGIDNVSSMLREGRRRTISTVNECHGAGRHRRKASSQLQNQPSDVGRVKIDAESTRDDTECRKSSFGPCYADTLSQGTAPGQLHKDSPADLDSLTKSLSALRFVPVSVLRKQNQKMNLGDCGQGE
jgi:hypothetical protein